MTQSEASGIAVVGVSKTFASNRVLSEINFTCQPGTVTGLLGPDGSGKTILLRIMTGLVTADRGRATYDKVAYRDLRNPGRVVGVVLDTPPHNPKRSVREILHLAAMIMRVPAKRIGKVLDVVGLKAVANNTFDTLSAGLKQRVCLAIAILGEPKYLLWDEPFKNLDIESQAWVRDFLADFAKDGGTALISTQLLDDLEKFCRNAIVLSGGKIVHDGSLSDLRTGYGSVVRLAESERLARALERRNIRYEYAGSSHEIWVDASTRKVHRICLEERIYLDELVLAQQPFQEAYLQLTQGQFRFTKPVLAIESANAGKGDAS